jgi:redox-sensitive bicupin YhaK (pirin superfamily)
VGPVEDLVVDVEYFNVSLTAGSTFEWAPKGSYKSFVYVIDGACYVDGVGIESQRCVLFAEGQKVKVNTKVGSRFLFVSGKPLNEPVAWGGPIVMNTQEELERAFQELDEGSFIKTSKPLKPSKDFYRS